MNRNTKLFGIFFIATIGIFSTLIGVKITSIFQARSQDYLPNTMVIPITGPANPTEQSLQMHTFPFVTVTPTPILPTLQPTVAKKPPDSTTSPGKIAYPPNLQCKSNGYCKMPNATDGSYSFQDPSCNGHHWGSKLLIGVIYSVAKEWKQKYTKGHVIIGDMTAAGHLSHMWGRAVDLQATTNGSDHVANSTLGNFNSKATLEFAELFLETKQILNIWDSRTSETVALKAYARKNNLPFQLIQDPTNLPGVHFNHIHVDVNLHPLLPVWQPSC